MTKSHLEQMHIKQKIYTYTPYTNKEMIMICLAVVELSLVNKQKKTDFRRVFFQ